MTRRQGLAFVATAALSALIPLTAHLLRRGAQERCSFDGAPLISSYVVRLETAGGESLPFCCFVCAEDWRLRSTEPAVRATCTDEITGSPLDCGIAVFVKSRKVTQPTTGNRIHAFARRSDALIHVKIVGGTILEGQERPLQFSPASPH